MIENQLDLGGAIMFWTLVDGTERSALQTALRSVGYESFLPERRSESTVLKEALEEALGGPRVLVRPLATRDGFAVVREERGTAANDYVTLLVARVQPGESPAFSPPTSDSMRIAEVYSERLESVPATQLSNTLVKLVDGLGGTRLRPGGAVYWLPGNRLDEWIDIVRALERSSPNKPNAIYVLRHRMDADAVRAVRDAVVHEVRTEARRLAEEVETGELGGRALETRKSQLVSLRSKVNLYEDMLSVGLEDLHEVLDRADQAAASASLLLGARSELSPVGVGG